LLKHLSDWAMNCPNNFTGPNAGGSYQFSIRTPLSDHVGQFYRSAYHLHVVR
jgi:hypothetical protein